MSNYTFEDLSPVDFEELTRDLLQKHLDVTLESFKEGRDSGIDLRYSADNKNTIIVQCKRYSSIANLKQNLKQEVKKVKKLCPKRYLIVTSVNLTPKLKKDIKDIFSGIKVFLKDILGKKDINNLIRKYPEIEKAHYKLWLNSTSVLEKILHSSIYNRSEFEKEEIKREIKIYVSNISNKEAADIMNKNNYVIISGIPGIGKTTLARMLLYNFLLEGWELISVSSDIKEAEELFQPGKEQVFYYDDFLGTNFFVELISKNEDKRIIKFIERVKKSKDKKLILTTREYILNQAIETFESLRDKDLELGKCTIDLKKYNKLIKGKILYNHLFYSELNFEYISEILKDNRFLRIINHQNYNPRLIQYLTDEKFIDQLHSCDYFNFFIENLANPHHIWSYAYNSHISSVSRYLLLVFLTIGEPVFKEDLYDALLCFFQKNEKRYGIKINITDFDKSLRECERTFINIEKASDEKIIIKFQNPSIKDFLTSYLSEYGEIIGHLLNGAIFFEQYFTVFTTNKYFNKVYLEEKYRRFSFEKLQKVFYSIPVAKLNRNFDIDKFDWIWVKLSLQKIERLEKLSTFFDLGDYKAVLDFLHNELAKIDLENEVFGEYEINKYLTVVERINEHIKLDGVNIIKTIFNEDKIENIDDLAESEKLRSIFPDEYYEFEQTNSYEITEILEKVVEKEYSKRELNPDKDKLEEFIEAITKIEEKFNVGLYGYHEKVNDLLSELDDNKNKKKKETKNLQQIGLALDDENEIIINIFNSLYSKVS